MSRGYNHFSTYKSFYVVTDSFFYFWVTVSCFPHCLFIFKHVILFPFYLLFCVHFSGEVSSVPVHYTRRVLRLHQCLLCHGNAASVFPLRNKSFKALWRPHCKKNVQYANLVLVLSGLPSELWIHHHPESSSKHNQGLLEDDLGPQRSDYCLPPRLPGPGSLWARIHIPHATL